jgi:hypothetical protein
MDRERTVNASEILVAAKRQGITRDGLQSDVGHADGGRAVDSKQALSAMRALLVILRMAEGKPY